RGDMQQLTIRAGRAYLVTRPEREAALRELHSSLCQGGLNVGFEITHYVPGRRGLPPPWVPEEVAIFIGSSVGSGLIADLVTDVYNRAKPWARRRYERKRKDAEGAGKNADQVKGERFIIYGPDGDVLKSWTIDKDGERESEGDGNDRHA